MLRSIPGIGSNIATYRQDQFERAQRRAEALGRAASELLDPEDLFRRIGEDERLADMFEAAVAAAVASSSDSKIYLLGRAVATGALATDEAGVDEAQELIRIAGQLEAPDLKAMLALQADRTWPGNNDRYKGENPVGHLTRHVGMTPTVATTVVARLRHLGLLEDSPSAWINDLGNGDDDGVNVDVMSWLSPAGVELLAVLRARGDD